MGVPVSPRTCVGLWSLGSSSVWCFGRNMRVRRLASGIVDMPRVARAALERSEGISVLELVMGNDSAGA